MWLWKNVQIFVLIGRCKQAFVKFCFQSFWKSQKINVEININQGKEVESCSTLSIYTFKLAIKSIFLTWNSDSWLFSPVTTPTHSFATFNPKVFINIKQARISTNNSATWGVMHPICFPWNNSYQKVNRHFDCPIFMAHKMKSDYQGFVKHY
jgi:hypothetical protein